MDPNLLTLNMTCTHLCAMHLYFKCTYTVLNQSVCSERMSKPFHSYAFAHSRSYGPIFSVLSSCFPTNERKAVEGQ